MNAESSDRIESYSMSTPAPHDCLEEFPNTNMPEQTFMLKRLDLVFNNQKCQLITFTDVTAF